MHEYATRGEPRSFILFKLAAIVIMVAVPINAALSTSVRWMMSEAVGHGAPPEWLTLSLPLILTAALWAFAYWLFRTTLWKTAFGKILGVITPDFSGHYSAGGKSIFGETVASKSFFGTVIIKQQWDRISIEADFNGSHSISRGA